MARLMVLLLLSLFSLSCVLNGSGVRIVSGKLSGTVPVNAKIGLFAPAATDQYAYLHDWYNMGDKDIVFYDLSGNESGTLTPLAGQIAVPAADGTYAITFPDDPSTVGYLIAWDDINGNGVVDLATEAAYLPVKTRNGTEYAVHHFSAIDALNLTYIAVYSTMDPNAVDYDLKNYAPHQDSLDTLGADGFNFNFR